MRIGLPTRIGHAALWRRASVAVRRCCLSGRTVGRSGRCWTVWSRRCAVRVATLRRIGVGCLWRSSRLGAGSRRKTCRRSRHDWGIGYRSWCTSLRCSGHWGKCGSRSAIRRVERFADHCFSRTVRVCRRNSTLLTVHGTRLLLAIPASCSGLLLRWEFDDDRGTTRRGRR